MNTNIKINIYYKIKQNSLILWRWLKYHWQQGGNSLIVLAWVVILYIIREVWESTLEFHLKNLSPGAKHSLPGWSPATGLNLFPAGCKPGRCLILNLQYHMHAADERSAKCHFYGTWEIQLLLGTSSSNKNTSLQSSAQSPKYLRGSRIKLFI